MVYYIAMAGLYGCLPNYCAMHRTFDDAVDDLLTLHDIPSCDPLTQELIETSHIKLELNEHGNEYCEVTGCECNNPEQHNGG